MGCAAATMLVAWPSAVFSADTSWSDMFACAWLTVPQVYGDHHEKPDVPCFPAIAGYPSVTIDVPGAAWAAIALSKPSWLYR